MKLAVVIPALNEEDSIADTIDRTLRAKDYISRNSSVDDLEVIVVSDGSTDKTVERAQQFAEQIKLIVFEKNQGYGAAIQAGWRQSDAELLAFVDADGTCDPQYFALLCNGLEQQHGDIVLGCRLNENSKMPLVRRIGNLTFSLLLTFLSEQYVRDTSSGMRVVRRSSLPKLLPLPSGMHFTPAMSARALMSNDLKVIEIDIPYHERMGKSKLRVLRDGLRFFRVILEAAFLYQPSRLLNLFGGICLGVGIVIMVRPSVYYLENRSLLEWMIYRFVVGHLAGTSAYLFLSASYLSSKIVQITLGVNTNSTVGQRLITRWFAHRLFWLVPLVLFFIGGLLVLPAFEQLVTTGAVVEHWSRFIAMSFLFEIGVISIITRLIDYILGLVTVQLKYLKTQQPAGTTTKEMPYAAEPF